MAGMEYPPHDLETPKDYYDYLETNPAFVDREDYSGRVSRDAKKEEDDITLEACQECQKCDPPQFYFMFWKSNQELENMMGFLTDCFASCRQCEQDTKFDGMKDVTEERIGRIGKLYEKIEKELNSTKKRRTAQAKLHSKH